MTRDQITAVNLESVQKFSMDTRVLDRVSSSLNRTCIKIETMKKPVIVGLLSDSEALHAQMLDNWTHSDEAPNVTMVALKNPAAHYGLDSGLDHNRHWRREQGQLWMSGVSSYTSIKIAVRGLSSLVAKSDTLFAHGCALTFHLNGRSIGVLVMGSSGAGKTTLVSSLVRDERFKVNITNDDWGPIDLASGTAVYSGERKLHMKAQSIRAFNPGYRFADGTHETDRLLVEASTVFGEENLSKSADLEQVVFLVRRPDGDPGILKDAIDLDWIERGEYSPFYRSNETFFNGSLLFTDQSKISAERQKFKELLASARIGGINNAGTPEQLKDWFLRLLETSDS